MKKILLFILMLTSISTFSQSDFVAKNWVSDFGNLYTPDEEKEINLAISKYEKATSIEIGVVTIDSLGNQSIEEYAYEQFNRLGIGKKGANNGLLLVFSLKDRKTRIEVGKGMEPFFTDTQSYYALEEVKSSFRKSLYFEGTIKCINFITNKLGNTPYTQKVIWLNEKAKKEAIESEIAKQDFYNGLRWTGIVLSFLLILGWIYWLDKRNRKLNSDIITSENFIKNYKFPVDTYGSKIASGSLNIITLYKNDLVSKVSKNKDESKEVYLKRLAIYRENLSNRTLEHNRLINNISNVIYSIKSIPNLLRNINILEEKAKNSCDKIRAYGYKSEYSSIDIDTLKKLAEDVVNEIDIDKSISLYSKFKSNYDYHTSKFTPTFNLLDKIENANTSIRTADSKISAHLTDVLKNKKWLKTNELNKIEVKIKEFNNLKTTSVDILTKATLLYTIVSLLTDLISSLKRRKSDEEYEDRRRNDYSSSSYGSSSYGSSGSSSSDSGFGGFGGGSSGGGGSSNDF